MTESSCSKAGRRTAVTSTSRSLLYRLRDNDAEAWERLIVLYTPLTFFWCRKLGVADQDIPDVVQEVFKAVARGIDRFRKQHASDTFRGWLRTITRTKAIDLYRRQAKQTAGVGGSEALRRIETVPDEHDAMDERDVDEEHACHALFLRACDLIKTDFRESTWKAFWRVVVDGRSPQQVAEELGMQAGAVRVAKSRVLQRLRQELGELQD